MYKYKYSTLYLFGEGGNISESSLFPNPFPSDLKQAIAFVAVELFRLSLLLTLDSESWA